VQNETKHHLISQHERRDAEMKEPEMLVDIPCMLPLRRPYTAVVARRTGCGKTVWVLRLIDNMREKIEPVPTRICYYYGEHQPVFNNYAHVHFEDGLPQLNDEVLDEVLDGREPTMILWMIAYPTSMNWLLTFLRKYLIIATSAYYTPCCRKNWTLCYFIISLLWQLRIACKFAEVMFLTQ